MALNEVTREEMQNVVGQLQEALRSHQQWHSGLIRTLVCQLSADKRDTDPDSHQECRFGQWYYSEAPEKLRNHPGFIAMGEEHRRMHHLARMLLLAKSGGHITTPPGLRQLRQFARAAAAGNRRAGTGTRGFAVQSRQPHRRDHPLRDIAHAARTAGTGEAPRPAVLRRHDGPRPIQGDQ